jgi:hypothetical protein
MPRITTKIAVSFVLLLMLSGCSPDPEPLACHPVGENYLQDTAFEHLSRQSRNRHWYISQHSSSRSFEYEAAEGTLTIRKTGHEPWFLVKQKLSASGLAGKRVMFGVELKLDLHPSQKTPFKQGGGMTITVMSRNQAPLKSKLEHETIIGVTDWQTEYVVLDLPKDLRSIQFGLIHSAEGTMQVRNPFIKLAPEGGCEL